MNCLYRQIVQWIEQFLIYLRRYIHIHVQLYSKIQKLGPTILKNLSKRNMWTTSTQFKHIIEILTKENNEASKYTKTDKNLRKNPAEAK